jgi:hypothetical protein
MAYESYSDTDIIHMKAGATVAAHRAVKLSAADTVIHCVDITDLCVGVALIGGSTGDFISIQYRGIAKMEAAEAITVNAEVMVQDAANDGSIAPAAGATARSIGVALEPATNGDGDIISVLLNLPNVKQPPNS